MEKIEREMKDVILIEFSNEKQFDKKKSWKLCKVQKVN